MLLSFPKKLNAPCYKVGPVNLYIDSHAINSSNTEKMLSSSRRTYLRVSPQHTTEGLAIFIVKVALGDLEATTFLNR